MPVLHCKPKTKENHSKEITIEAEFKRNKQLSHQMRLVSKLKSQCVEIPKWIQNMNVNNILKCHTVSIKHN